jgi:pyruvate,water dikinase
LVAGFDSKLFRPTEELQKLALLAQEHHLSEAIMPCAKWDEAEEKLGRTEIGRKWLNLFEAARHPWFEMSCGTGWYHYEPTWNQNLDIPFIQIKHYIETLMGGETITRPKAEVLKERDRVTSEYRSYIRNEDDKKTFDQMISIARMVAPYAEDHMWYCTNYEHSLFFQKMRDLGEVFKNHQFIKTREDIFYFTRYEIAEVLYDLCSGWAIGVRATGTYYWPERIDRRKEIMEKFKNWDAPPALGPAPEVVTDPFLTAFWGITTERINSWLDASSAQTEGIQQLKGAPASGGDKVGIARVCRNIDDISSLQPGEILVASTTSPTWSGVFQMISGCVTDIGGIFCHAAIVAREYGMPAVVGTGYATKVIKTGDKVRVDGYNGIAYILEKG